jgi:mannose-6-phosphate isomerase
VKLMKKLPLLKLAPQYRDYVWGGQRLRPGQLTAEAWVVHEDNLVESLSGQSLAELSAKYGQALLGRNPIQQTGERFPLLIKLLDCADWLSVQVHPNDEQAVALEGDGHFGKTEAWHILDAAPDAELIAGLQPGTSAEQLRDAIRSGHVAGVARKMPAGRGDTFFIRPGTLHALGPGLLLYEVQQTSNLTYRVYDWDRPMKAGRVLHIEKSLAVADPSATATYCAMPEFIDGDQRVVAECPYFTLEALTGENSSFALDTQADSFHALTLIAGDAVIHTAEQQLALKTYETVIVPAELGAYKVEMLGAARMLKSSVV